MGEGTLHISKRDLLKIASGAVVGATIDRILGPIPKCPDNKTPAPQATKTAAPIVTPQKTPEPQQTTTQLLVGKDYAQRVPKDVQEKITLTEKYFKNYNAQVEILPAIKPLSHPRVADDKGTDPYFYPYYQSLLSNPAENTLTNKDNPAGVFGATTLNIGFYSPNSSMPGNVSLFIPESTLSPYIELIDGINIYTDNTNNDPLIKPTYPQFPSTPLNQNNEGPCIGMVNITSVGELNSNIVMGLKLKPGRYHLITWRGSRRIPDTGGPEFPPPVPKEIKLIFWSKDVDLANNNPKKLEINLTK